MLNSLSRLWIVLSIFSSLSLYADLDSKVYEQRRERITELMEKTIEPTEENLPKIIDAASMFIHASRQWNTATSIEEIESLTIEGIEQRGLNAGLMIPLLEGINTATQAGKPEFAGLMNQIVSIINPELSSYLSQEIGLAGYTQIPADISTRAEELKSFGLNPYFAVQDWVQNIGLGLDNEQTKRPLVGESYDQKVINLFKGPGSYIHQKIFGKNKGPGFEPSTPENKEKWERQMVSDGGDWGGVDGQYYRDNCARICLGTATLGGVVGGIKARKFVAPLAAGGGPLGVLAIGATALGSGLLVAKVGYDQCVLSMCVKDDKAQKECEKDSSKCKTEKEPEEKKDEKKEEKDKTTEECKKDPSKCEKDEEDNQTNNKEENDKEEKKDESGERFCDRMPEQCVDQEEDSYCLNNPETMSCKIKEYATSVNPVINCTQDSESKACTGEEEEIVDCQEDPTHAQCLADEKEAVINCHQDSDREGACGQDTVLESKVDCNEDPSNPICANETDAVIYCPQEVVEAGACANEKIVEDQEGPLVDNPNDQETEEIENESKELFTPISIGELDFVSEENKDEYYQPTVMKKSDYPLMDKLFSFSKEDYKRNGDFCSFSQDLLKREILIKPEYLDNLTLENNFGLKNVFADLYHGLIVLDDNLEIKLAIAEEVKLVSANMEEGSRQKYYGRKVEGYVYTFRLKENYRWANGESIVAKDFLNTFERMRKTDLSLRSKKKIEGIKEVFISDDYTLHVVVEPKFHSQDFIRVFAEPELFPTHQSLVDVINAEEFHQRSLNYGLYNGPYMLREYRYGDSYHLVRNPEFNHIDSSSKSPREVVYQYYIDFNVKRAELESESLHLAHLFDLNGFSMNNFDYQKKLGRTSCYLIPQETLDNQVYQRLLHPEVIKPIIENQFTAREYQNGLIHPEAIGYEELNLENEEHQYWASNMLDIKIDFITFNNNYYTNIANQLAMAWKNDNIINHQIVDKNSWSLINSTHQFNDRLELNLDCVYGNTEGTSLSFIKDIVKLLPDNHEKSQMMEEIIRNDHTVSDEKRARFVKALETRLLQEKKIIPLYHHLEYRVTPRNNRILNQTNIYSYAPSWQLSCY